MTRCGEPNQSRTMWRSAQHPDGWSLEQSRNAAVRAVVVHPLVVGVEPVVDGTDPFRDGRGVGVAGSPGQLAVRHLAAPWLKAVTSPAKGASPRSTRSRSTATKSCSGTLSCAKSDGSTIGPRPSPARAASIASSVMRRQVLEVSAPTGAHDVGVVRRRRDRTASDRPDLARTAPSPSSPPGPGSRPGPRSRPR